jgi:hypothetical protein
MGTNNVETTRSEGEQEELGWHRHQSARMARHLSVAAFRQCERALSGVIAVPAALALGGAAGMMFVAAIVENGFELVESSITDVGRRLDGGQAHGERQERARFDERPQAQA